MMESLELLIYSQNHEPKNPSLLVSAEVPLPQSIFADINKVKGL